MLTRIQKHEVLIDYVSKRLRSIYRLTKQWNVIYTTGKDLSKIKKKTLKSWLYFVCIWLYFVGVWLYFVGVWFWNQNLFRERKEISTLEQGFPGEIFRLFISSMFFFFLSGANLIMEEPSNRQIKFLKVTIQDGALFEMKSIYGQTRDIWNLTVKNNSSIFF